jgi:hypothetical protein
VRKIVTTAVAAVIAVTLGWAATSAQAAHFYRGHVSGQERARIGLVVTPKNRDTRRLRYVITGAVRLRCDHGATKWHFRFDPFFGQGIVISPPSHRFGLDFAETFNGRTRVNTRMAGRITQHTAHGRLRIRLHDPRHGACDSGKRHWHARRG